MCVSFLDFLLPVYESIYIIEYCNLIVSYLDILPWVTWLGLFYPSTCSLKHLWSLPHSLQTPCGHVTQWGARLENPEQMTYCLTETPPETQAFFKGPMILRLSDTHPFQNKYRDFKVEKFHILILEFFQTFGCRKGFHLSTRHTHLHIVRHPWIHRTRSAPEQGGIWGKLGDLQASSTLLNVVLFHALQIAERWFTVHDGVYENRYTVSVSRSQKDV